MYYHCDIFDKENLDRLPELSEARDSALQALKKASNVNQGEVIDINQMKDDYYSKYFPNNASKMSFRFDDTTLLDVLSTNTNYIEGVKGANPLFSQAFKTAADKFNLIESANTRSVIVEGSDELFPESHDHLDKLIVAIEEKDYPLIKKQLKLLQPFTIQVYGNKDQTGIYTLGDLDIFVLMKEYYSSGIGLNNEKTEPIIF